MGSHFFAVLSAKKRVEAAGIFFACALAFARNAFFAVLISNQFFTTKAKKAHKGFTSLSSLFSFVRNKSPV
jgi:hypothetical protein